MGRKAVEKIRKDPTDKVHQWLTSLLLKLQSIELAHLTIDDLAKLSGKSKSNIYKYFESKEDLILAACQTRLQVLQNVVDQIAQDKSLVLETRYTHLLEQISTGMSDITISFLYDIQTYYPRSWKAINAFSDSFVALMEELYLEGMQKGLYHPISLDLLGTLDRYFVTQVVTNQQIFKNPDYHLSHLIRDYMRLRLYGLSR